MKREPTWSILLGGVCFVAAPFSAILFLLAALTSGWPWWPFIVMSPWLVISGLAWRLSSG